MIPQGRITTLWDEDFYLRCKFGNNILYKGGKIVTNGVILLYILPILPLLTIALYKNIA